jgi:RNA polymerase sigma-70 factor (ECF subfamily)
MAMSEEDREFARLVDDNRRAVQRFVLRRLSDPESSEDVVTETFTIAWRKRNDVPPRDRELSWLFGIAFRVLSNHRRSRDRRIRLHGRLAQERETARDEDESESVETGALLRAMRSLGDGDRELLQLVYWERLKYRDIAIILKTSENAVAIRATRAKKSLRVLLGDDAAISTASDSGEEVGA